LTQPLLCSGIARVYTLSMAPGFSTFHNVLLAALLTGSVVLTPAMAQAQTSEQTQPKQHLTPPAPPPKLPRVGPDRGKGLDFLFGALKAAPDQASAKHVEAKIWALWNQTSSDTTALLMQRASTAIAAKQTDVALKLLDAVVKLKPDYVEAWNRRATLYYLQNDYTHSLQDIEQVLVREPRHFGALAGLGMIMQEFGDDKRALDAFRRALAINPHLDKVPELVKTLTEKVEGRDI